MKYNIAFVIPDSFSWTGEINYFSSILNALDYYNSKKVNIIIFCGKNNKKFIKQNRFKNINVIYSSIFEKNSFFNLINKIFFFLFGYYNLYLYLFLKSKKIDFISHYRPVFGFKNIVWFPDFQHLYLKKLFNSSDIRYRDNLYFNYIKYGDIHLVSSKDSKKDLVKFNKKKLNNSLNVSVLNFVPEINFDKLIPFKKIIKLYKLNKKYIYVPNQFWIHKNHFLILKCINLLKKQKKYFQFIFTGSHKDYRNRRHFNNINEYISQNKLNKYIKYLKEVPYNHVMSLMYNCSIFINPSLFEGWSTTVEEAKAFEKKILISNISVHKEQKNNNSILFDKNDEKDLLKKIIKIKNTRKKKINYLKKKHLIKQKIFAKKYIEIIAQN